jgi:hypothetical protein
MNSRTLSLALPAPREEVSAYLSNIENLPNWATIFCKELKVIDGKYKVVTPTGELFFEIQADKRTGVIDMFAGPNERQMNIFPVRVLHMPGRGSIVLFTMFQTAGMTDEQFDAQHKALEKELENVRNQFMLGCKV